MNDVSPLKGLARVLVTRPIIGICFMQVCAVREATDEEILQICNQENPSGTSNGWSTVYRGDTDWLGERFQCAPVVCESNPERAHFIVGC